MNRFSTKPEVSGRYFILMWNVGKTMVQTTHDWEWFIQYHLFLNGDDWGMVQMTLFYPHYQLNRWCINCLRRGRKLWRLRHGQGHQGRWHWGPVEWKPEVRWGRDSAMDPCWGKTGWDSKQFWGADFGSFWVRHCPIFEGCSWVTFMSWLSSPLVVRMLVKRDVTVVYPRSGWLIWSGNQSADLRYLRLRWLFCIVNGHFRILDWRYLPYIRPM